MGDKEKIVLLPSRDRQGAFTYHQVTLPDGRGSVMNSLYLFFSFSYMEFEDERSRQGIEQ